MGANAEYSLLIQVDGVKVGLLVQSQHKVVQLRETIFVSCKTYSFTSDAFSGVWEWRKW